MLKKYAINFYILIRVLSLILFVFSTIYAQIKELKKTLTKIACNYCICYKYLLNKIYLQLKQLLCKLSHCQLNFSTGFQQYLYHN